MNLVDDAKEKAKQAEEQLKKVSEKTVELAEAQQKLKDQIADGVDMTTSSDEAKGGGDYSLGAAITGEKE